MEGIFYFNSRPSARGDAIETAKIALGAIFQFTPLREGRPVHALGREEAHLFQFTPLREGRLAKRGSIVEQFQFQFTPLREGRPWRNGNTYCRFGISIHAPPRGATLLCWYAEDDMFISIHAPPRGATKEANGDGRMVVFQFTPLREGRPVRPCDCNIARIDFNSRPSARGDFSAINLTPEQGFISIHAPPRGATEEREQEE